MVGELHLFLIEVDAVAEDGEDRTCTHDVRVEAFFLQGIVLCQSRFIYQIHGFLHRIFDVLVIRSKREEEMVEHFNVALCFHIQGLFHGGTLYQYGHVPVQYIHFLLCIRHHAPCRPDAGDADKDAADQEAAADDCYQLDFVFKILDYHNLLFLFPI